MSWRTCSLCGEAAPPDGTPCPTCGYEITVAEGEASRLSRRRRIWVKLVRYGRVALIVTIIAGLSFAVVDAVYTGPTTFADPLSTHGFYTIPAGQDVYINGSITGEDYVQGNYTVIQPPSTLVTFEVFNSSEWGQFVNRTGNQSQQYVGPQVSGLIVFSAPYTDNFYLAFANPYPAASGISVEIYLTSTYESNVVLG